MSANLAVVGAFEKLHSALARAESLADCKRVLDQSVSLELMATHLGFDEHATEAIKISAVTMRRMGELSKKLNVLSRQESGAKKGSPNLGRPSKLSQLQEAGLTKQRAAEHEKVADIPDDVFRAQLDAGECSSATLLRIANGGRALAAFSSESVEWYTPAKYIEAARAALGGFDLDPASSTQANEVVKAEHIFTNEDNGLDKPWHGRVWLNPPYALIDGKSSAGMWGEKLIYEHREGRVSAAVLLVNAVTDAGWFQPFWDFPICFTDHRIEFYTPKGQPRSPVSGNAFIYLGSEPKRFSKAFEEFGPTVVRL